MGGATIIEKCQGTDYVSQYIYGSWWFTVLWAVLVAFAIVWVVRQRMRKWNILLLHLSFVFILAGALLTHIFSYKGMIHLRVGETSNVFYRVDRIKGMAIDKLPFRMRLNSFNVHYYKGTQAASDYESWISVIDKDKVQKGKVSMNHIFTYSGVRFYQRSYDEDKQGCSFTVNSDPYGIAVTYIGYALLFFSLLWLLVDPKGTFRRVLNSDMLRKGMLVLMVCGGTQTLTATTTLAPKTAEEFGKLKVVYNNRVCDLQTLAYDFTKKLYGKRSYKGCSPEQVVAGFIFWGSEWECEPIIKVKGDELKETLQLPEYISVSMLFNKDMGGYTIGPYVQEYYIVGMQDGFHKEVTQLDDKIKLIMDLRQGVLLSLVAVDSVHKNRFFTSLYKDALTGNNPHFRQVVDGMIDFQKRHGGKNLPTAVQTKAERINNQLPLTTILFIVNLTLGFSSLFVFLWRLTRKNTGILWLDAVFFAALVASFAALTFVLSLRWIISGHIPMSNGYETMLIVAWFVQIISLLTYRKARIVLVFGFMLSGFFLLVSHISQMDPAIGQMMPVLNSPLLSVHVSVIMMSYALLSMTFICGIMGLALPAQAQRLRLLSQLFLYPAITTMGLGIFIGAIWANISWGTYWSWDPKETWALITFMTYAVVVHTQSIPVLAVPRNYHWFMVLAFTSILMTYFGVNYFLGGMHSYA